MGKFILYDAKVEVNNADLSNYAFSLDTPEESDQVDVSGFSPTRTREFLLGLSDQTITVGFLQDVAGTAGPHAILQPLYSGGSVFPIKISYPSGTPDVTFGGSAQLFTYNGLSGELNARAELSATFKPASNSVFEWGTA